MAKPRQQGDSWTEAETGRVIQLWTAGATVRLIADQFPRRSELGVHSLLHKLRKDGTLQPRQKPHKGRPAWMVELFVKAVESGISTEKLAVIFEREPATISAWRTELGLTGRYERAVSYTLRDCLGWCGKKHKSTDAGDRFCEVCKTDGLRRFGGSASLSGVRLHDR